MESILSDEEVTEIVIDCIDNRFPKDCSCCGRRYSPLAEYLRQTAHAGRPVSHGAEIERWMPRHPLDAESYAICPCGSTLAIGTARMGLSTMWRLLQWAKFVCRTKGLTTSELLATLRNQIDKGILGEAPEASK